jgi:hypothetical protein
MLGKLSFPRKLAFTLIMSAGCGGDDGPIDGPIADGSAADSASVDSRPIDDAQLADGTVTSDGPCFLPCAEPFFDAAPGIDAAMCPDMVCEPKDCEPPCLLLV